MSGFKPGDVAMVTVGARTFVATRHSDDDGWTGVADQAWNQDRHVTSARPLVVLDPEALTVPREGGDSPYGAKDLARTLRLLVAADHGGDQTYRARIVSELADVIDPPPKPPEPVGLGAVVEDAEGQVWVRVESAKGCRNPWQSALSVQRADTCDSEEYAALAAVKVLSEGVTP